MLKFIHSAVVYTFLILLFTRAYILDSAYKSDVYV